MPTTRPAPSKWLLLLLLAVLPIGPATAAPTVSASVDRAQLAVGESTVLSIEILGSQDAAAPQLAGLGDFRVQYIGPATQMRFENGRTSTSITHRYQVYPRKPGNFELGPFDVAVEGRVLRTLPIAIKVVPRGAEAKPGTPQLRLEVRVAETRPYVGARAPLTIRLLIPQNVRVDDLQFPIVEGNGVVAGPMPQPAQRDERIGGQAYRVLYFENYVTVATPMDADLVVKMNLSVVEQRRGGRRGVFDMFNNAFANKRPVELRSEPLTLSVRPLPREGRPAGFAGAVGKFDLEVSASPTTVNAGDPVTVRVIVRGDGDLSAVRPPRIAEGDDLRVYDPVPLKDLGGGARGFEQVVIPQSSDVTELPVLELSFFDPQAEAFRTIRRGPIRLQVGEAAGGPSGVVSQGDSGRAERAQGPLGRDIVYIKGAPGDWSARGRSLLGSWLYWVLNLLPPVTFAGLWWRWRQADLLAANPKLRRFLEAEGEARRALASLGGHSSADVDRLSAIVASFLSAKLDLPPGAIEAGRVARALGEAGFDAGVCERAAKFFAEAEALRYAPNHDGTADNGQLRRDAESIIASVESRRDLAERFKNGNGARVLAALLTAVALAGAARADVVAETEPEAAFFTGNHAYADGRYDDAIESYRDALASGEETGALHFNLANAYFKRGDVALAVASYLRAQRMLPRDPDVAANLAFAEESLEIAAEPDPLWRRVLFAPAYRVSQSELALTFTLAWWGFWIVMSVALLWARVKDPLRWPTWILAIVAAVAFANLFYRGTNLELWRDAVVMSTKDATVRFEPAPDGTEHFAVPPGSRLVIEEEREGWNLVSRTDGRRGWVQASELERLR